MCVFECVWLRLQGFFPEEHNETQAQIFLVVYTMKFAFLGCILLNIAAHHSGVRISSLVKERDKTHTGHPIILVVCREYNVALIGLR